MKKYYVIVSLFLLLGSAAKSQNPIDTVFTSDQVRRIAYVVDSLSLVSSYLDSLNKVSSSIIKLQTDNLNKLGSSLLEMDNMVEDQKDLIISLQADLEKCNVNKKYSFLKSPKLWFGVGFGLGLFTVLIVQ